MQPRATFSKALLLSAYATVQVRGLSCYTPTGDIADYQAACPGVTENTPGPCCNSTGWPDVDPCLSNGMCLSTKAGFLYTGGCTSGNWYGCRDECTDFYVAPYAVVTPCYTPQADYLWCCGFIDDNRTKSCCENQRGYNFSGDGYVTIDGPLNASSLTNVTTSIAALEGDNGTGTNPTGACTATDVTTAIPGDYVKSSVAVGVGVGLGVPLLIALATVAWLWMALRRQGGGKQTQEYVPAAHFQDPHQSSKSPMTSPPPALYPAASPAAAELKAEREIYEVPGEPYRSEASTERI